MENVKFLDVVFENCEDIIIPIDRIADFSYGELTLLTGEMFEDGNCYKADYLSLKINYQDDSDLEYSCLDYDEPLGMYVGNPVSNNVADRPNVLGRLMNHNDVVGVWMLDENEEVLKVIYAPWGGDQYVNTCMSIKAENGLIEIEIKE
jgi:hypothetical protein